VDEDLRFFPQLDRLPAVRRFLFHYCGNPYMLPLKDLGIHKSFHDLPIAHAAVNHVAIYYNEGHPGVPDPHYHIVLWYISPAATEALK
jgi:hypothetical protein